MVTIYEVMKSINNFFTKPEKIQYGEWKIENGALDLPFLRDGQYFLCDGSDYNDLKAHIKDEDYDGLVDETFKGYIVPLYIPDEFIEVCSRISAYCEKHKADDGYTSESFGGYSYSKATHADGTLMGWADTFRQELNAWRKI